MDKIPQVDQYIGKAADRQVSLLEELRNLIAEAVPEVKEQFKWGQPVYSLAKDFVYLKHTKKHVNLGFFNYEKVADPTGLLEGTGARMRHIKIVDLTQFNTEELKNMIVQASKP